MKNNDKQKLEIKQNQLMVQQHTISSPLPPPEWLEKYNNINPNIVDEILKQYKQNSEHTREINKQLLEGELTKIDIIRLSQWHGFIATIIILLSAVLCGCLGYEKICLSSNFICRC